MPTIVTATTTPTILGITRQNLIKRWGRRTGFVEFGTHSGASSLTALTVTGLIGLGQTTKSFVGGFVRVTKAGAAAPEGEIRPITAFTPGTGALTVSAFSANVESADELEIHRIRHPQKLLDEIDESLTEDCWYPCWTLLTEVADGDMEQSHTTDWTASNATVTKQTAEPSMYGKRYLRVVATSAGGYAQSNTLRVEPGDKYHLSALARVSAAATTARLQAYDITNSAEIDSEDSVRLYPGRINFEFTVPATCYSIAIRLITVENSVTTEWDEVCLYPINASEIKLPWWLRTTQGLLKVFELQPDSIADHLWDGTLKGIPTNEWVPAPDTGRGGTMRLVSTRPGIRSPLFICGLRNEIAYANDYTETKLIQPDQLLANVLYKTYLNLSSQYIAGQSDAANFRNMAAYWQNEYRKAQYAEQVNLSKLFTGPRQQRYILDGRFQFNV